MSYSVHEIFLTLQGEGMQTGRLAVFCRFAGCNLWTGRERDRATAICRFCDTQFVGTGGRGGGRFATAEELAAAIESLWPSDAEQRFVVMTGGEPLLQLDEELVDALHLTGYEIAVETNGTRYAPAGLDWICVSPKAGAPLRQREGNELKLVFPQDGFDDVAIQGFEELAFENFLLQPKDGPDLETNTDAAVEYCNRNPRWRLTLQSHKLMGIP